MPLDQLSPDLLLNILCQLDDISLELALTNLPRVCRDWSVAFAPSQHRFWSGLAARFGIRLSPGQRRQRTTRQQSNLKRTVQQRKCQLDRIHREETDQIISDIGKKLRGSDCVAFARKQLTTRRNHGNSPGRITLVNHGVKSLEHRTLLHLACWFGQKRTVHLLLNEFGADLFQTDDLNATPLLIAAWAGHALIVRALFNWLRKRIIVEPATPLKQKQQKQKQQQQLSDYLNQKGAPPLTSSCGGRGPKTALCWAKRKQFRDVVCLLEQAGAKAKA